MTGLYQQLVPVSIHYLKNLSAILHKAAAFCEGNASVTSEKMLSFRLIDDMRGIPYQVQSCSNTTKLTLTRLGSTSMPTFEDNEATFEELQTRIQRTIELLQGADQALVDSFESKEVIMETKMGNFRFASGQTYVSEYVIPNFHFHLSSAYCILRHLGVPLGAMDYLKDVFHKVE